MVSQTLLNLFALTLLAIGVFSSVNPLDGHHGALIAAAFAPLLGITLVVLAPALIPSASISRAARVEGLRAGTRRALERLREGLRLFRHPRHAALAGAVQLSAWALQWVSCWLLLMAFGLDARAGIAGAATVLFAVNATAVIPATPANVGLFQAACVAVLVGSYHVALPEALAFAIVLQLVELAAAAMMGLPALVNEGLSWRDVRLRTLHAAPVKLGPLPRPGRAGAVRREA
jgi:phosphatidylinositol alpha-mannosyltransferase